MSNLLTERAGCINNYFTSSDTYINITGSGSTSFIEKSDSWREYYNLYSGYNFTGFKNEEAGVILKFNEVSGKDYFVNYTVNTKISESKNKTKQHIKIKQFPPINEGYPVQFSYDEAWASYNVTSGMNSKRVFSYAVDIQEELLYDGYLFTGTGVEFTTKTGLLDLYKRSASPQLITGFTGILNQYQIICELSTDCGEGPEEPLPKVLCWTGKYTTGTDFDRWIDAELSGLADQRYIPPDAPISLGYLTGASVKQYFSVSTGHLLYNSWIKGDSISWNLYNFDYTGTYKKYHLNNLPTYPTTGFTLVYPEDWTSIDSLVNKLNQKLNEPMSYPVWYPYDCLSGTASGIYISGALMRFWKNIDVTGIGEYNNRIDFVSLRTLPQVKVTSEFKGAQGNTSGESSVQGGYLLNISLRSDRDVPWYSGYSYLLPDAVQLEGFDKQTLNWKVLDKRTNLFSQLRIKEETKPGYISRIKRSVIPNRIDDAFIGSLAPEEELNLEDLFSNTSGQCSMTTLLEFNRTLVKLNKNRLCPPALQSQEVKFVYPDNCPPYIMSGNKKILTDNKYWCNQGPPEKDDKGEGDKEEKGEDKSGPDLPQGTLTFIRTGWNLTGQNGINALYDEYDQYRLRLIHFRNESITGYLPKNYFIIENINLYSLTGSGLSEHVAESQCILNSDYIVDVGAIVPIKITGYYNYTITPAQSGKFQFNQTPFLRKIEDFERSVRFNRQSGYIISDSGTGFLSLRLLGSGLMSYSTSDYYFYDPTSREMTFEKQLSKTLVGSGYLSGKATVIKQSVINKELMAGGRLSQTIGYFESTTSGYFSGQLNNVKYKAYDLTGYYEITGVTTGLSESGFLKINKSISGYPSYTSRSENNSIIYDYPYYPVPTGYTNATGFININYNNLQNFDILSINNSEIIYNSDSDNYLAPIFFDDTEMLLYIINNNSGSFLVSAQTGSNQNIVYLNSLISGESGNSIKLSISNNQAALFNGISLSGGKNYYPLLEKPTSVNINSDVYFTSNLVKSIPATGFYTDISTGYLTGLIKTYLGDRDFNGIWNLKTGLSEYRLIDFDLNNFIESGVYKHEQVYADERINNLIFYIIYKNNKNYASLDNPDIAELTIKDLYNTGVSGMNIMFRITGII